MYAAIDTRLIPAAAPSACFVLEAKGISKAYGHVQALDRVDFEIHGAEVVALIGDNGAGKSTLVKILSGVCRQDAGQIYVGGKPVTLRGPADAERLAGIAAVYQDLALVDVRDVASNIYLNIEPLWFGGFINFDRLYADARRALSQIRIDIPSLKISVSELSGGQRQAVAIARALVRGQRIFLLDEPTAALGIEQQGKINQLIGNLKEAGKAVVVISHNLEHVFAVADRLIVLRRGRRVGTRLKTETTKEEIVSLITGAIRGDA
jgi:D-xylose transport system ATP-binding protein